MLVSRLLADPSSWVITTQESENVLPAGRPAYHAPASAADWRESEPLLFCRPYPSSSFRC